MNKNTFCSLPFTSLFLGPDGGIKPCCSAIANIGNINTQHVKDIINGNEAKEIRNSILQGKWHPSCKQCKIQSEKGTHSERKDNVEDFKDLDLSEDYFDLQRLDLRWSNTCNLSCVYCYEYFSSKWAVIKGQKVNTISKDTKEDLINYIKTNGQKVQLAMLLGGEPLLQKENESLLEVLNTDTPVHVVTNLAVDISENKIAKLLMQRKKVTWAVSFENVTGKYEYVRHGASWNTFVNNLKYLKDNVTNFNCAALSLYSIHSAFNLEELYDFVILQNCFNDVVWTMLESTGANNKAGLMWLNPKNKHRAIKEIDKVCKKYPKGPGIMTLKEIKKYISLEKNIDYRQNHSFINEIKQVETQLGTTGDFSILWPKLYRDIKRHEYGR